MTFEKIGIATARINGLTKQPYYFNAKCFWAWDIMFSDVSTILINNLPFIYLKAESEEEAQHECDKLKENFYNAGIHDKDEVAVLFDPECGAVRAISSTGRNFWIDVRDGFTRKTFDELDIIITSLKVY